ncbi:hypothetical protein JXA34_01990 [Patescibacteria group bacterium]|nr:hypothetical protein [Patescibacteria group bacterium]
MSESKKEELIINDIGSVQREFYRTYDPDYWLYKIQLLTSTHDNFDKLKGDLAEDFKDFSDEDFKRMLRTELHFLYYQMTETLFEIIFALMQHDNWDLWLALTFSNDSKTKYYSRTYSKIEELVYASVKPWTGKKQPLKMRGEDTEIPMLRWIFYFSYPSKMDSGQWDKNLEIIEHLLISFARDFSDKGEYNAYKHSLRFHNTSFAAAISSIGMKQVKVNLGGSKDSVVILERHKKRNSEGEVVLTNQIARTIKPFDFERDQNCCLLIHALLSNIILTRKYTLLNELHGKKFDFFTFNNIQFPQIIIPKTGITRHSFTV